MEERTSCKGLGIFGNQRENQIGEATAGVQKKEQEVTFGLARILRKERRYQRSWRIDQDGFSLDSPRLRPKHQGFLHESQKTHPIWLLNKFFTFALRLWSPDDEVVITSFCTPVPRGFNGDLSLSKAIEDNFRAWIRLEFGNVGEGKLVIAWIKGGEYWKNDGKAISGARRRNLDFGSQGVIH
ncbi:hypothetical protein VNO77_02714 [Canavalia gladiata]|uniref:Uncharacterized protein n=1 Tax=Canavalia gladiata TaxID=3824 RepID=A0AAN9MTI2_CANGL